MWYRSLVEPLSGKTRLWKVIWIYGFGVSIVYTILGWAFVPETPVAIGVYTVVGLALGIVQSIMLWKCAYNSGSRAGGRLIRLLVVIGLLLIPLMLYVVFKHPELLVLPTDSDGI